MSNTEAETYASIERTGDIVYYPHAKDIDEKIFIFERRKAFLLKVLGNFNHYVDSEIPELRDLLMTPISSKERAYVRDRICLLSKIEDIDVTVRSLIYSKKRLRRTVVTESGEPKTGSISGVVQTTEEILTDNMGDSHDTKETGVVQQAFEHVDEKKMIADFLSRPIPLYSAKLPLATDISIRLSVWDLMTLNPAIRSKLRNFMYFRGTLHLNISVSGTPFHLGRLLVSYQPWADLNDPLNALLDTPPSANLRLAQLCYLSQAPGSTTIDIKENKPTHVVCPFVMPKPKALLSNAETVAISAATSFDNFEFMGDLFIYSINNIASVSTSPSVPYIFVRGWFEDVEVTGPTGTVMAITTESGRIITESGSELDKGPVEKFSSNAAEISGTLMSIPWLSPYAKASEMVFSALGHVSSLFGWAKPIMNTNSVYVKQLAYRNGAQTIGTDTNFKLSLDPKQELAVDSRSAGVDQDDMTIAYIAGVESFLTTFTWSPATSPLSSIIWKSGVCPYNVLTFSDTLAAFWQPTALSFAVTPFRYWRGTMKYRIEIVASQYHRGKLLVGWEPNARQIDLIDNALSTNKQYAQVIDIQETQNVEFCVEWINDKSWLRAPEGAAMDEIFDNPGGFNYSTSNWDKVNGIIFVTPYTELQSPDNSSVSVNVYVSSPEMHVNTYASTLMPQKRQIVSESGEIITPDSVTCLELNGCGSDDSGVFEEYFGERIVSFRSLLKRYQSYYHLSTASAGTADFIRVQATRYPFIRINYQDNTASVPVKGNLYEYLRFAYLGLRGSVRHRTKFNLSNGDNSCDSAVFSNVAPTETAITNPVLEFPASTAALICDHNGGATFVPHTNGGFEVDLPYYHNAKFLFSFNKDLFGGTILPGNRIIDKNMMRDFKIELAVRETDRTQVTGMLDMAAGEDFIFMRFQGAPCYAP